MMYPNRYYCSVLKECRKALEKLNVFRVFFFKKQIAMLLEELQVHGNRMEAAIQDKADLHRYHCEAKVVHDELKVLNMNKEELEAQIGEMQLTVSKGEELEHLHKQKIQLSHEVNMLQKEMFELTEYLSPPNDSTAHSLFLEKEVLNNGHD